MNEFVSWCRHLLVSFLFHALTSLHPPSFHRNDFSTCYNYVSASKLIFILFQFQGVLVCCMSVHTSNIIPLHLLKTTQSKQEKVEAEQRRGKKRREGGGSGGCKASRRVLTFQSVHDLPGRETL